MRAALVSAIQGGETPSAEDPVDELVEQASAADAVVNRHAVTIATTADVENRRMVFPLFERVAHGNP